MNHTLYIKYWSMDMKFNAIMDYNPRSFFYFGKNWKGKIYPFANMIFFAIWSGILFVIWISSDNVYILAWEAFFTLSFLRQSKITTQMIAFNHLSSHKSYHSRCIYSRGCQIGMQGPQLCAKPRHFCKLGVVTFRMAFLDLNLHVLQLATSNSNNWGRSVVQNCTSGTP